jgi:hypothetical protein
VVLVVDLVLVSSVHQEGSLVNRLLVGVLLRVVVLLVAVLLLVKMLDYQVAQRQ